MPKDKVRFPEPGSYSPKLNLGEDDILRKNARTIIGKSTYDILDFQYKKKEKEQVPGPGSY